MKKRVRGPDVGDMRQSRAITLAKIWGALLANPYISNRELAVVVDREYSLVCKEVAYLCREKNIERQHETSDEKKLRIVKQLLSLLSKEAPQ